MHTRRCRDSQNFAHFVLATTSRPQRVKDLALFSSKRCSYTVVIATTTCYIIGMAKKPPLGVRLETEEHEALARAAAADNRSASAMARKVLADWLRKDGWLAKPIGHVKDMEMSQQPSLTPIRPARDWKKLLREARDGGYSDSLAVTFIADNTTDSRADGENRMFAKGYHEMISGWIEQQNVRVEKSSSANPST